jgi:hypothetical protein
VRNALKLKVGPALLPAGLLASIHVGVKGWPKGSESNESAILPQPPRLFVSFHRLASCCFIDRQLSESIFASEESRRHRGILSPA